MTEFLAYRNLFLKLPAYEWLLPSLHKQFLLVPAEPNVMSTVRDQIINSLTSTNVVGRRKSLEKYKIPFRLEWDMLEFVNAQGYREEPEKTIGLAN